MNSQRGIQIDGETTKPDHVYIYEVTKEHEQIFMDNNSKNK